MNFKAIERTSLCLAAAIFATPGLLQAKKKPAPPVALTEEGARLEQAYQRQLDTPAPRYHQGRSAGSAYRAYFHLSGRESADVQG